MTYSIVARDPQTGDLGVAVQSHWFSVGPVVPWARPGVGAVATQAIARVANGPEAIELLERGDSARDALAQLVAKDEGAQWRQVAIAYAGHVTGEQVSCQANIMASETVWGRMLEAFEGATGPLAERFLLALEAAEAAGGDLRGRQSAAILVVPAAGEWWETTVSLRVEDHPDPLPELRRLMRLHDAYALAGRGDELTTEGDHDAAAALYRRSSELAPDNHELLFWSGLGLVQNGDFEGGLAQVRAAIELQPGWAELLTRMPDSVSPALPVIRDRLS